MPNAVLPEFLNEEKPDINQAKKTNAVKLLLQSCAGAEINYLQSIILHATYH